MTRRSKWKTVHRAPKSGKTKPKEIQMRSGLEKKVAESMDRRGVRYEYEKETLYYVVPEQRRSYKPDFILPNRVIIEVKGRFTAADRKKMSLVIEQNPDKDIRLLFQCDNKISSNSKTRYSDWCDKRGIKYCVSSKGEVPKDWLEEEQEGEETSDE